MTLIRWENWEDDWACKINPAEPKEEEENAMTLPKSAWIGVWPKDKVNEDKNV